MKNENKINYDLLKKARMMIFAAHGAPVESQVGRDWCTDDAPDWEFPVYDYRIRPDWLKVPEGYEIVPLGEAVPRDCRVLSVYDDNRKWEQYAGASNGSPLFFVARPVAKPEPRLQLQEGKWYRRRDGEVVGPLTKATSTFPDARPFAINCLAYNPDGSWNDPDEGDSKNDLIEEVPAPESRKVPLTKEDWDGHPVWWVRETVGGEEADERMVFSVHTNRIQTHGGYSLAYDNLLLGYERSHDRKTWTPCWKLEDER